MAGFTEPHPAGEAPFSAVIEDKHFRTLLRLSHEQALTWDSFLTHPLPQEMSPLQCWNAIMSLGRCLGVELLQDAEGNQLWYRRTSELNTYIDALAAKSTAEGKLMHLINDFMGMGYTDELRREEAAAALALAGLVEDPKQFAQGLDGVADPITPEGKLARNFFVIDCDLEHYRSSSLSGALAQELYARLTKGVDASSFEQPAHRRELSYNEKGAYTAQLLSFANTEHGDDSLILRGSFMGCEIRRYRLFGTLSPLMASLLVRLFYLKHNLPLLALTPVAKARLEWQNATNDEPIYEATMREVESTFRRAPGNITLAQTISAACMTHAVNEIEQGTLASYLTDNKAREALLADKRFNHRQRSILARALRVHNAEFSARYHQSKNAISYATARRDLTELEELGYLAREQRGKGIVFVCGPALAELLNTESNR